jgi:hypothetical protein
MLDFQVPNHRHQIGILLLVVLPRSSEGLEHQEDLSQTGIAVLLLIASM